MYFIKVMILLEFYLIYTYKRNFVRVCTLQLTLLNKKVVKKITVLHYNFTVRDAMVYKQTKEKSFGWRAKKIATNRVRTCIFPGVLTIRPPSTYSPPRNYRTLANSYGSKATSSRTRETRLFKRLR